MRNILSHAVILPTQDDTHDLMLKTYNTAWSQAAEELLDRWKTGQPISSDAFLEVVKLLTPEEDHRGFAVYLVWGEPRSMGPMRAEIDTSLSSGG